MKKKTDRIMIAYQSELTDEQTRMLLENTGRISKGRFDIPKSDMSWYKKNTEEWYLKRQEKFINAVMSGSRGNTNKITRGRFDVPKSDIGYLETALDKNGNECGLIITKEEWEKI